MFLNATTFCNLHTSMCPEPSMHYNHSANKHGACRKDCSRWLPAHHKQCSQRHLAPAPVVQPVFRFASDIVPCLKVASCPAHYPHSTATMEIDILTCFAATEETRANPVPVLHNHACSRGEIPSSPAAPAARNRSHTSHRQRPRPSHRRPASSRFTMRHPSGTRTQLRLLIVGSASL